VSVLCSLADDCGVRYGHVGYPAHVQGHCSHHAATGQYAQCAERFFQHARRHGFRRGFASWAFGQQRRYRCRLDHLQFLALHNQVIEKYHLKEHYKFKGKFHADLLREFRKNFGFEKNKEDLFSVSIEDEDYHLAAEMLRFILAKADSAFNAFKTSQARQSRIYFQSRLDSCERVMDSLLVSFAQFQVDNNFYDPEVQLEATIKYMGELQAKREEVAMEMSFEKMNRGDDSKRYDELSKRYRGVTNALNSTLEGKRGEVGVLSLKKSPALAVEYLRRESELKIQETLVLSFCRQQSEQMRLEEAKMLTNLHILEPPWENNKKVSPLRGVSLIFTVMVSSLFVTLLCNFIEFMKAETARGSRVADDWASITRFFRRKSKKKA
jgi:hypothetical protein